MKKTIHDIARASGVSVTTVSLILNGKGERFAAETIERVKRIAKEMNYRPNRIAASLITRQSKTIGLIVPDIRNPFFSALVRGVDATANELGWSVILSNSGDNHRRDLQLISVLDSHYVDGIIFCMAGNTNEAGFIEVFDVLNNLDIPFILVDRYYPIEDKAKIVTLDHELGGYLATRHLLELGHKKIGCITGPLQLVDAHQRLRGYKRALEEKGITPCDNYCYEGNYHSETGAEGILALLNQEPELTAIFACNDLMALGAYDELTSRNYCVPRDFSIVGYDDIMDEFFSIFQMTTIHQPILDLGRIATEKIIQEITGKSIDSYPMVEPSLKIRESTAPPRTEPLKLDMNRESNSSVLKQRCK